MTTHDPHDPTCRCGWADGALDELRAATPKRAAYLAAGVLEQVPHLIRVSADHLAASTNEALDALVRQLGADVHAQGQALAASANEALRSVVEQLNAVVGPLQARVAELEARAAQPPQPITVVMPEQPTPPAPLDAEDLARRVAAQLTPPAPRVRDVERDQLGNIVRIVES